MSMAKEVRWDKVFKGSTDKYERMLTILYWYLLKKPDYNYNIAKGLEKISENKSSNSEIKFPKSLTGGSNLTPILKEMCKKGLIEQYEKTIVKNKERHYYRISPEFLIFPYHLEFTEEELEKINEEVEKQKEMCEKTKRSKKSGDGILYGEDYICDTYNCFGKRGLFLEYISYERSSSIFDRKRTAPPFNILFPY